MKKLIYVLMTISLLINPLSTFADDTIIIPDEPLPTINKAKLDIILIKFVTNQAEVIVRKGFIENGQFVPVGGKERSFLFINRLDDPMTPEIDPITDYTDFMNTIKIDKQALKILLKQKLNNGI